MNEILTREINQFLSEHEQLPLEQNAIAASLDRASSLLDRYYGSAEMEGTIPNIIIKLGSLHGSLAELNRHATRRTGKEIQKRGAYSQSEQFKIQSLQRQIAGYEEQLNKLMDERARERVQKCLAFAQKRLRDVVEAKVSARDSAIRRQELKTELMRLRSKQFHNMDADVAVELGTRIASIELELQAE